MVDGRCCSDVDGRWCIRYFAFIHPSAISERRCSKDGNTYMTKGRGWWMNEEKKGKA